LITIVKNIGVLYGVHSPTQPLRDKGLADLPAISNAWISVEGNVITGFGIMNDGSYPGDKQDSGIQYYDAAGGVVLPCWCDSHTHLVFAASREEEFVDKIRGLTYSQIAEKGGGILNSARKLNLVSEDELFTLSWNRLQEIRKLGTGAVEIKSGYGLTLDGELKMLRVIRRLKEKSGMTIKSTFLGAHSFPEEYKHDHESYIRIIIEEMIPRVATEKLADYIDVFCESGFFSPEETIRIVKAGQAVGLKPKIHANQLNLSGGVQAGELRVLVRAAGVAHLQREGIARRVVDDQRAFLVAKAHALAVADRRRRGGACRSALAA